MTSNRNQKYVQFSKRIVIAVTIAVTVICVAALVACWIMGKVDALINIVKQFINYAKLVFVAYSGNSAIEKGFVYYWKSKTCDESNEDED